MLEKKPNLLSKEAQIEDSEASELLSIESFIEPSKKSLDNANSEILKNESENKDNNQLVVDSVQVKKQSEPQKRNEISEQLIVLSQKHKEISDRVQNILMETVNLAMSGSKEIGRTIKSTVQSRFDNQMLYEDELPSI